MDCYETFLEMLTKNAVDFEFETATEIFEYDGEQTPIQHIYLYVHGLKPYDGFPEVDFSFVEGKLSSIEPVIAVHVPAERYWVGIDRVPIYPGTNRRIDCSWSQDPRNRPSQSAW